MLFYCLIQKKFLISLPTDNLESVLVWIMTTETFLSSTIRCTISVEFKISYFNFYWYCINLTAYEATYSILSMTLQTPWNIINPLIVWLVFFSLLCYCFINENCVLIEVDLPWWNCWSTSFKENVCMAFINIECDDIVLDVVLILSIRTK